jgi:hypothetical protein
MFLILLNKNKVKEAIVYNLNLTIKNKVKEGIISILNLIQKMSE